MAVIDWTVKRNQIGFAIRIRMSRWGMTQWVIAGALVALAVFEFGWVLPAVLHRMAINTRALSVLTTTKSQPRSMVLNETAAGLSVFYREFPPASLILNATAQINSAAEDTGVHISQADYHLNQDSSGLQRVDIALTANATYPKFKQFTAAVLTYLPTTSLDGVSISRNSAGDGALEIQLHFSLFSRPIEP